MMLSTFKRHALENSLTRYANNTRVTSHYETSGLQTSKFSQSQSTKQKISKIALSTEVLLLGTILPPNSSDWKLPPSSKTYKHISKSRYNIKNKQRWTFTPTHILTINLSHPLPLSIDNGPQRPTALLVLGSAMNFRNKLSILACFPI